VASTYSRGRGSPGARRMQWRVSCHTSCSGGHPTRRTAAGGRPSLTDDNGANAPFLALLRNPWSTAAIIDLDCQFWYFSKKGLELVSDSGKQNTVSNQSPIAHWGKVTPLQRGSGLEIGGRGAGGGGEEREVRAVPMGHRERPWGADPAERGGGGSGVAIGDHKGVGLGDYGTHRPEGPVAGSRSPGTVWGLSPVES